MINYQDLKKIEISLLKRSDLSVSFRFEEAIPYIERLIKNFLFFENRDSGLMQTDRQIVSQSFNTFYSYVMAIQNFQSDPDESTQTIINRRNSIIEALKNVDVDFTKNVLPILLRIKTDEDEKNLQTKIDNFDKKTLETEKLINTKISTFESNFTNAQNTFTNITNQSKSDFDNIIQSAQKELNEARQIKNEAKNFTVEKIVERYGSIFSNQAKDNLKYARMSLIAFIITLITIVVLTFVFFFPLLERIKNTQKSNNLLSTSTASIVSSGSLIESSKKEFNDPITMEYLIVYMISRLTILGLASILLKETLKNYNVNMHLHTLNLHRQHSLESFDMLVSNTFGRETRDQIITELAQTIYSNQEDGYLSNSDKKTISIAQVTELIKALK